MHCSPSSEVAQNGQKCPKNAEMDKNDQNMAILGYQMVQMTPGIPTPNLLIKMVKYWWKIKKLKNAIFGLHKWSK